MSSFGSNILVTLSPATDALWRECHALENEMVLTCTGRRIFPTLEYMVANLNPNVYYTCCLHLELCDDKKLRYSAGKWLEALSTETVTPPRKVWHLNGSILGSQWMLKPITFDQIRITNKKSKEDGNSSYVHLHTQHRYMPVLSIYECAPDYVSAPKLVSSHRIVHSQFITVTAYHKEEINTLKTNNNPYSTGSRKDRRRERQSSPASESDSTVSTPRRKRTKKEPATPVIPMPAFPQLNMFQAYYQLLQQQFPFGFPFLPLATPPSVTAELAAPEIKTEEPSQECSSFESLTPPAESPALADTVVANQESKTVAEALSAR